MMIKLTIPNDENAVEIGVKDLPVEPEEIVTVITGVIEKFYDAVKLRALQDALGRLGEQDVDIS